MSFPRVLPPHLARMNPFLGLPKKTFFQRRRDYLSDPMRHPSRKRGHLRLSSGLR